MQRTAEKLKNVARGLALASLAVVFGILSGMPAASPTAPLAEQTPSVLEVESVRQADAAPATRSQVKQGRLPVVSIQMPYFSFGGLLVTISPRMD